MLITQRLLSNVYYHAFQALRFLCSYLHKTKQKKQHSAARNVRRDRARVVSFPQQFLALAMKSIMTQEANLANSRFIAQQEQLTTVMRFRFIP